MTRGKPATVNQRYRALAQFWKWAVGEEIVPSSPMAATRPPTIPERQVPVVSEDDLRKLLAACEGGIKRIHPHHLRHTFVHDWLSEGGAEGDMMMLVGWRSRQMLQRYAAATAAQRAADAYRRSGIGDRL